MTTDERPTQPSQSPEIPAPTAAEMIAVVEDPEADPSITPAGDPTQDDEPTPPLSPTRTAADLLDYFASVTPKADTPEAREAFFQTTTAPVRISADGPEATSGSPEERAAFARRVAERVGWYDGERFTFYGSSGATVANATKRPVSPGAERLLGVKRPVLGEGYIALVDYMGNDEAVARSARVSYGQGTRSSSDDAALVEYLLMHRHSSPVETPTLHFLVKAPIFVARQWFRHRTASVSEVSYRYSEVPEGFYLPDVDDLNVQDTKNRQGRGTALDLDTAAAARNAIERANRHSQEAYQFLTVGTEQGGWGLAREIARQVQPVATWTEFRWKQDLHNLLHFLSLRLKPNAQLEIRRYAEVIAEIVAEVFPVVWAAWYEHVFSATTLSAQVANQVGQIVYLLSQGKAGAEGWRLLAAAREALPKRQRRQFDDLLALGQQVDEMG